jgi:hypothetical protein
MPVYAGKVKPSRSLANVIGKALAAVDFVWRSVEFEITYLRLSRIPFGRRLRAWLRGCTSDRAVLYDFDDPSRSALYVSDARRFVMSSGINAPYSHLITDKLAFWALLKPHTNLGAPVEGVIRNGMYFPCEAAAPAEGCALARAAGHWSGRFILKPQFGSGGSGILLLEADGGALRLDGAPLNAEQLAVLLGDTSYLLCPLLEQAEYARRIFPGSANTMRLLTVYDEAAGTAAVVAAAHRFGRSGMLGPVDNWNQGGLAASVDVETGVIGPATEMPYDGVRRRHTKHPDTGAAIDGVQVPGWAGICAEIVRLANRLGYMPYIGWDVLVTRDAFAIVEANNNCGMTILQIDRPLLESERLREFYVQRSIIPRPKQPRPAATGAEGSPESHRRPSASPASGAPRGGAGPHR